MNLPPTEVRTLPLQSNNCRLKFKNPPAPMQSVELNWDNQGFQSVHSGSSITETNWLTPPSSFMTIGIHNLKINFTAINSFSREYIVFVTEPCQRFYVDGTISSLTTGNTLTLWDNPNCPDAEPLLLSEGFDPTDSRFPEFYRFQGDELTQRIFELGYKVYVLNYNLAGQNMQNNAAVYIAALRYLSQINDGKKVVAAGMSMGGVITRYALAKGEGENLNLPVSMFLSLDAPQQGAVIDRPFQDLIKSKQSDNPALNAPVSRQLLINHAWENGESHNAFYNELNALNGDGYPHRMPRIGVAFSNNTPNPNTGTRWLRFDILGTFGQHNNFFVTNEWAQAGSLLPGATTNIETGLPSWASWLPGERVEVERFSHPTFIPFNSALDITNGVSKFPIRIEANAASAHDEVPPIVVTRLGDAIINLGSPSIIASNETYNFTSLQGNWIRQNTTVFGNLVVNQSGASGSSFNPEPPASISQFDLTTRSCAPIMLNVESNGKLEVGGTDGNNDLNAKLILKFGDVLHIESNATLRVRANSQIVIGSGSRLIIENGANINLVGSESKIIIQNGGQLVINGGTFQPTGAGHLRLEQGHVTTYTGNLTLRGANATHRFLVMGQNAQWVFPTGTPTFNTGIVQVDAPTPLSNARIFVANSTVSLLMQNITFNMSQTAGLNTLFTMENMVAQFATFLNCNFNMPATVLETLSPIVSPPNTGGETSISFYNCIFNNAASLNIRRAEGLDLQSCVFNGGRVDAYNVGYLNFNSSTMRGNGTGIGLNLNFVYWMNIDNSLIDNYDTGIDASQGMNGFMELIGCSVIQRCGIGIKMNGGLQSLWANYPYGGISIMNSQLLENNVGIAGNDIVFDLNGTNDGSNAYKKTT